MARLRPVTLNLSRRAFVDAMIRFQSDLVESSDTIKEIIKLILELPKVIDELVFVDRDLSAAGTNEVVIPLKPSDCFTRILSAVRTGDLNLLTVEHSRLLEKLGEGETPIHGSGSCSAVKENSKEHVMTEVRLHCTTLKETQELRACRGKVIKSVNGNDQTCETVVELADIQPDNPEVMTRKEQLEFMNAVKAYVVDRDNYHCFDNVIQKVVNRAFAPISRELLRQG